MKQLSSGAAVIERGELAEVEGTRSYRVPISRAMGARDIAQSVSAYSEGRSPARRNPVGEEVLYVTRGNSVCYIDGHSYALAEGDGVYIPPGSVYQIENPGATDLEIVSVCCPEDYAEFETEMAIRPPGDTKPFRVINENDQPAIPVADRTFRLLVNQDLGAQRVTQFVGVIPPGRAPMHYHTYEEAMFIIKGQGRLWTDDGDAPFNAGASIYLPRGVRHCVENTGQSNIRLLGVFHPSGSPAAAYDD
ncbi:MAG TPA: cupin domain-containing protein [Blastocatellia bacterium]|nr:cupin domain-containing protein [Blastocatellia bacterium]